MRTYRISDLTTQDMAALCKRLEAMDLASSMDGLYWLPVPQDMLSEEQAEHQDECGPYAMGLECDDDWISLELLVRARSKLRCSCVHYAAPELRAHMMDYLDGLLAELGVSV